MPSPAQVLAAGLLATPALALHLTTHVPGGTAPAAERPGRQAVDSVTFSRDVAPILHDHCVTCHRPDGAAPFSLVAWDSVEARASEIREVTRDRFMPPWLPEAGHGEFVGDRRLSESEIELIERWVDEGPPRGDPDAAPDPPEFSGGWYRGEPDLVMSMPEAYEPAPDSDGDVFRNFVLDGGVDSTRWIEAIEIRPGDPRLVHHAVLLVDETPFSALQERRDPGPGFEGMTAERARPPDGFLPGWTPGRMPREAHDGAAWELEPGTDLVLQLHLRPSDRREEVRAEVGLYFADGPPDRRPLRTKLAHEVLDIPPGDPDYVVRDSLTLPVATEVLSVYPHAHYLADEMRGYAVLPDGGREWLIRIDDWNFDFQDSYQFADPVRLPAGSRLVMEYSYDNTADNPHNPADEPRRVLWGLDSEDEMAELHVQLLAADPSLRPALQAYLGSRGRPHELPEYARHYRTAVEMDPEDARSRYQLGAVLAAMGRAEDAAPHLERAMEMMPDWWLPPTRLARVLATAQDRSLRDPAEAVRLAESGVELTGGQLPLALEVLSLAYAAAERWTEAADAAREAATLAEEQGREGMAARLEQAGDRYAGRAG